MVPGVLCSPQARGHIPDAEPHTWDQKVSSLAAVRRFAVPFVIKAGRPKHWAGTGYLLARESKPAAVMAGQ